MSTIEETRIDFLNYQKGLLDFYYSEEFKQVPFEKEQLFLQELYRIELFTATIAKCVGRKRVLMFKEGELRRSFSDELEAAILTEYPLEDIQNVLNHTRRAYKGYTFTYLKK